MKKRTQSPFIKHKVILGFIKNKLKRIIPAEIRFQMRAIWQSITWPFYSGSKYFCPCCKTGFRIFLHFYGQDNVRCPRCNSLDRHRLQWLYLQNRTGFFSESLNVLHFAPEAVFSRNFKHMPNLNYITADALLTFIDGLCIRPDIVMDICDIRFPSESFDVIICNHVLEHVKDDRKGLSEIFRVLKVGGWAILQVPIRLDLEKTLEDPNIVSAADRSILYGSPDHVRFYGRDYKIKLESVGFSVNIDKYIQDIPPNLVRRYSLNPQEDLYIAKKEHSAY